LIVLLLNPIQFLSATSRNVEVGFRTKRFFPLVEAWRALVWKTKKLIRETVLDDSQESGVCNVWLDLANLPDHLTKHPPVHDPLETCHDAVENQSQLSDLRFHLTYLVNPSYFLITLPM
jgi:hypothetical protein